MTFFFKSLKYLVLIFICFFWQHRLNTYAVILDADTLLAHRRLVRLEGIDAPEKNQICFSKDTAIACGHEATRHLYRLIDGKTVVCHIRNADVYGRLLGECYAGKTFLNKAMVDNGHAFSFLSHGMDKSMFSARKNKKGLWQYRFERPASFRQRQKKAPNAKKDFP